MGKKIKKLYFNFGLFLLIFLIFGCQLKSNLPSKLGQDLGLDIWVSYFPKQCQTNPWEQSGLATETEAELVRLYYQNFYQIEIVNYQSIPNQEMVCAACNCLRGDEIRLLIHKSDLEQMAQLGFTEINK